MSSNEEHDREYRDERTEPVGSDEYDVDENRAWEPPADDDVARRTAASDDEMVYADGREGDDSWLGMGLASILVVSGVLLFLFPEPATSLLGIGLIVAGLAVWVASAMT